MWTLQQSHDIITAQLQCCGQIRRLLSYSISHCGNNHVKTTMCMKIQTLKKNSLAVTHVSLIFSAGLLIYCVKTTLSRHTVLVSSCFVQHVKMTSKIKRKNSNKKTPKNNHLNKGALDTVWHEEAIIENHKLLFYFRSILFRMICKTTVNDFYAIKLLHLNQVYVFEKKNQLEGLLGNKPLNIRIHFSLHQTPNTWTYLLRFPDTTKP